MYNANKHKIIKTWQIFELNLYYYKLDLVDILYWNLSSVGLFSTYYIETAKRK